ncbi:molybdopterin-dependent oxidoreductase [Abyssisolibacter fermentans]|uniref:molybdopterin-dependent oxidoreductase n=1 Tax=Abyssisolibacter fermentans TaxID=1766203 RepID=UPI0008333F62|nr:molybdopterin-dependent oxidoreductase [Abyssisolibacter fermentans]
MSQISLNINGIEVKGYKGQTILEIARENNIEIPTLCYDKRVQAYGSCGLCVVEVEGTPKLLRACSTVASDGMVVKTNTNRVRESRKSALELLLSDHEGDCRPPCVLACPAGTDCQGYVGLIANGEYKEALKLIKEQLPLPASIGRVCPHPCENACRRQLVEEPISIAWLKSFVADIDLKDAQCFIPKLKPKSGKSVAVIGGGPGGLSCAYFLAKEGHKVVMYEAMPEMGGMLRYGIPQYRLPKEVLNKEISIIEKMGVKMYKNIRVGRDIKFSYLRDSFDAVYVSIGAWESASLNCPGDDLENVIGGINFLRKFAINEPIRTGDRIAVVGGGNTAMDACRTAIRLGAKEVYLLYRRTEEEMPADYSEIVEAREEGVIFKYLVSPLEIIGKDGKVDKIRLQKMQQGPADASGRRRPIPIEGEEEIIEVDSVICSIGQRINSAGFEELEKTNKGNIVSDLGTYQTSLEGVFAGGDATNNGAGIAIQSIGDAKNASTMICRYLNGEKLTYKKPFFVERENISKDEFKNIEKKPRTKMPHLKPEIRKHNFEQVIIGYSEEAAKEEAMRCLECGCHDYFECELIKLANEYEVEPSRFKGENHSRKADDNHPFIQRNVDKCILCGLCVRVCEEVMGVGALDLIDRGFDTIVKSGLDTSLKNSDCIACGQCISVCPTGALGERLPIEKSVPLKPAITNTICSGCSVGCNVKVEAKGDLLLRSKPNKDSEVDDGLLCIKGRFGYNAFNDTKRITSPMIRKDGELKEVTIEEAALYVAKRAKSLSLLYGSESLAVSLSDRYTNEEIFIAKELSGVLNTDKIASFNRISEGIVDVLGYDASTNTFEELLSTDTIIAIEDDIFNNNTIVGLKIKQAVKAGAKLITINKKHTKLNDYSSIAVNATDISFLKEIAKAILDIKDNKVPNVNHLDEFIKSLDSIKVSEEAKKIAEIYVNSKKAMIVFEQNEITADAAKLIANIAVIAGHIGKARSGIIQLKANNNSQGLADIGITMDANKVIKGVNTKTIKGLLVFGEDISDRLDLSSLEFLMVQDTHVTETAKFANVVLPAAGFAESNGTFTNSERRIQPIKQAIKPLVNIENWQIIMKLANALSENLEYNTPNDILTKITRNVPEYFDITKQGNKGFWPVGESRVLYNNGFATADSKANLAIVDNGILFNKVKNTDSIGNRFKERIKEAGLVK